MIPPFDVGLLCRHNAMAYAKLCIADPSCRIFLLGESHISRAFTSYTDDPHLSPFHAPASSGFQQFGTIENVPGRDFFRELTIDLYRNRSRYNVRTLLLELDEVVHGASHASFDEYVRSAPSWVRHRKAYWYASFYDDPLSQSERALLLDVARNCSDCELVVWAIDSRAGVPHSLPSTPQEIQLHANRDRAMAESIKGLLSGAISGRSFTCPSSGVVRTEAEIARGGKAIGCIGLNHTRKRTGGMGTSVDWSPMAELLSSGPNAIPASQITSVVEVWGGDSRAQFDVASYDSIVESNYETEYHNVDYRMRLYDLLRASTLESNVGFPLLNVPAGFYSTRLPTERLSNEYDGVFYFRDTFRWHPRALPTATPASHYDIEIPMRITWAFPDNQQSAVRPMTSVCVTGRNFCPPPQTTIQQYPLGVTIAPQGSSVAVQVPGPRLVTDSLIEFVVPPACRGMGNVILEVYFGSRDVRRASYRGLVIQ